MAKMRLPLVDKISGSAGRIVRGVAANLLGKLWVTLIQLVTIPVLSAKWGATGYGVWVMLSAIPTYIALSGIGFGNAAATDMVRRISHNDFDGALEDFQSVWVLVSSIVAAVALLAIASSFAFSDKIQHIMNFDKGDIEAIALFAIYSFLAIQSSLINTGYRCTRKYALGTALFDAIGLVEGGAVVIIALSGGNKVGCALAMVFIRAGGTALFYGYLRRLEPWFWIGWKHASRTTLVRLSRPALASLGLSASSALALQGVVMSLGIVVSPGAAAAYSAARTICRIPLQLSDLLSRATLPEMTAAFARRDRRSYARLSGLNVTVAVLAAFPICLALALYGVPIAKYVSRGNITFGQMLFVGLALSALAQAVWQAAGQSLQATNDHHLFTYPYLFVAGIMALSPLFLGRMASPEAVAFVVAIGDASMCVVVFSAIVRVFRKI